MPVDKLLGELFWTDRWAGSTAFQLPIEPRGLYREMLTAAWRRGARLPNDHEAIRRVIGCTAAEWRRCWPKVKPFWKERDGHLVNETQLEVYAQVRQSVSRNQARASAGGKARAQALLKHSPSATQAEAQAELEHCNPDPDPDLRTSGDRGEAPALGSLDRADKPRAPRAVPPVDPIENRRVITRLVHELLDTDTFDDEASFTEAVKQACAERHIAYSSRVIGLAMDAARGHRAWRQA